MTTVFFVDFVLKLKGIKIIEAKTDKEKKMVYRLRYNIYREYKYINSDDFPDKELKDEEDKHSIIYIVFRKNKSIGTFRFIIGDKKEDFPIFRMCNVNFKKFIALFSKIGEVSKLGVIKSENKKHLIWFKMITIIYWKSKRLDLDYCLFFSPCKMKMLTEKKLNTRVDIIPCLKETKENLEERKLMSNYFKSLDPLACFSRVKDFGKL